MKSKKLNLLLFIIFKNIISACSTAPSKVKFQSTSRPANAGGDLRIGPKIGIDYFPANFSSSEKIELNDQIIDVHDFYKPYVGFACNQRLFHSVKTSYAG